MNAHTSYTLGNASTFDTLPVELIIKIVCNIPFSSDEFQSLLLVNTRMHDIVTLHERTIVKGIAATQFPLAEVQYPGIRPLAAQDYTPAWLLEVRRRTEIDRNVMDFHERNVDLSFVGRDMCLCQVFAAGLSILWTVYDCDGYDAKVECIESLRGWHLGVLQHALAQAEKLAFKYSTEFRTRSCNSFGGGLWLEATHCFRELLLTHSPLFLEGILTNETSAADALRFEIFTLPDRQHASQPTTLLAHLNGNTRDWGGAPALSYEVCADWEILCKNSTPSPYGHVSMAKMYASVSMTSGNFKPRSIISAKPLYLDSPPFDETICGLGEALMMIGTRVGALLSGL